ncbi:MAG TPA: DegV family protein [Papillibacter sp.]|nr:DegV family protein [Papillibacter sp.]
MTIKITSDSTCDLAPWILRDFDISLIPLYIIKGGHVYRDGVDITPPEIFRHVEKTGEFPSTAAVNPYDYDVHFEKFAAQYGAVIHISIGSGFSMCWQNAAEAAKRYKNVFVFDSKNLSSGQGHLVLEAARMARNGALPDEILKRLYVMRDKVETSFLIDRLDYIFKGGRCSLATAIGANIMHLRTCVEVSGGKMVVKKKYRGSFESAVSSYVRDRLGGRRDLNLSTVFVTHTQAPIAAVQAARNAILQEAEFVRVIETRAGCTVSCHCGPRTLGILFMTE